jgi:uncharacterized protein (DUF427 family)
MTLTMGRGPFSTNPAGRFQPALPRDVVYVEPLLRRVRARLGERTVIDSQRVLLVHRRGQPPRYAFPAGDVTADVASTHEPAARGYVSVKWDAVTSWYEEDEQVFGHAKNPYHRIDCVRSQRQLRVQLRGVTLVDTRDVVSLFETASAPRLYVEKKHVQMEHLIASSTTSHCPYKGYASYWSAQLGGEIFQDIAWSYEDPTPESRPIAGLLSFYPERAEVVQDIVTWFEAPNPAQDG